MISISHDDLNSASTPRRSPFDDQRLYAMRCDRHKLLEELATVQDSLERLRARERTLYKHAYALNDEITSHRRQLDVARRAA